MIVRRADPRSPEARALLGASQALLASLYPPEDNFFLSVDELSQPHVDFWVAEDGAPLGCVALARFDGYGEVKSLFVEPSARGRGGPWRGG
jgi:putative acetyltransferase